MSITTRAHVGVAALFAASLLFISLPNVALAATTINAPTLNGAATVAVAPGTPISIVVSVTTTNNDDWESTSYRIGSTGSFTCVNTANFSNSGTSTATFNISTSTPGTYNLEIRTYAALIVGTNDTCGTTGLNSQTGSKIVTAAITIEAPAPTDTTPPLAPTIDSGPAEGSTIVVDNASFTFSDTEVGATFECAVDAGAFAACTSPKSLTALTNGAHSFAVRAKDAANNTSAAVTRNFTVNVPAPACPAEVVVPGNLITNPSFESSPAQSGWSGDMFGTNNAAFSITTGHSGVGCNGAQATITTYTNGDAKWTSTAVPVTAGQNYTFSNWYKSDVETFIYTYFVPTGGNPVTPTIAFVRSVPSSSGAWAQLENTSIFAAQTGTLVVAHVLQSMGTLVTDDYSLVTTLPTTFSEGIISLTFDDGWTSIYDSIMTAGVLANYKSTQYVNSVGMNQVHGPIYMNSTQVKAMFDAGHEIGGHTTSHADLTQAGVNFTTEINNNKTDLEAVVGAGTVKTFAYPYGAYNSTVVQAVQNAGYTAARSVDQNYNTSATDKYLLKIQRVGTETTIADIKGWIDTARTQKTWLILMFHEVVPNNTTDCLGTGDAAPGECSNRSLVQEMTNYLGSKTACVLTVAQVLAGTPCSATPPPPTDTAAPVITIPGNISVVATSSTSIEAQVSYTASAVDVFDPAPVLTCSPASNSLFAVGSTTVTCVAKDVSNNYATSTFVVSVTTPAAPNQTPTATAASVSTDKNVAKAITLEGTDPEGSTLVYSTTTSPTNGTLSGALPNLTYTPTTNYTGSDSFSFVVFDGAATSTAATISITVNAPAPAPTPAPSSGGGGGGGFSYYGSVQINNGAATTTTQTVSLTFNSNASQVWISNEATFLTGGFVPKQSSHSWVLPVGAGQKTIYVRFGVGSSTVANAQATIALAAGAVLGVTTQNTNTNTNTSTATSNATCYTFAKNLNIGSTGADVTALQNRLTAEGVYSGPVTGTFGPLTFAGVKGYQAKVGLPQVGNVGPMTRAELNKCSTSSSSSNSSSSTTGSVLGVTTGFQFTRNLGLGSSGADVTELQNRLTSEGVYTGPVTGTFGPLTMAGVKGYQTKKSLPATGYVGALTRAELNK